MTSSLDPAIDRALAENMRRVLDEMRFGGWSVTTDAAGYDHRVYTQPANAQDYVDEITPLMENFIQDNFPNVEEDKIYEVAEHLVSAAVLFIMQKNKKVGEYPTAGVTGPVGVTGTQGATGAYGPITIGSTSTTGQYITMQTYGSTSAYVSLPMPSNITFTKTLREEPDG